jgi:uncharacterized Zn finger protein
VAATLYGVGAKLDSDPDLLFTLRGVDRAELVSNVGADLPLTRGAGTSERVLQDDDVAALFGIDIAAPEAAPAAQSRERKKEAREPVAAAAPAPPKNAGSRANAGATKAPAARPLSTGPAKTTTAAAPASPTKLKKPRQALRIKAAKGARSTPAGKARASDPRR